MKDSLKIDYYVFDKNAKHKSDETFQKEFNSKLEVWNFLNDEGLKKMGYNSPMEMDRESQKVLASIIAEGMTQFENGLLKIVKDANGLISCKIK